ncbi:hypothetical protein [Williamsia sp. 1135]|uniref:hypothetical protein n=1 Tax=Williamsia sp. 1135 TaxID=1889262 RepID=UPI00117FFC25|nr:hypothetical protein [Williamsia sp. 1135]
MANTWHSRTPTAELGMVVVGLVSALIAMQFREAEWWFLISLLISLLISVFGAIAAVVTLQLSKLGPAYQLSGLTIGMAMTGFSVFWWAAHRGEPEIFSPTLLGYFGAGLLLSSVATLAHQLSSAGDPLSSIRQPE